MDLPAELEAAGALTTAMPQNCIGSYWRTKNTGRDSRLSAPAGGRCPGSLRRPMTSSRCCWDIKTAVFSFSTTAGMRDSWRRCPGAGSASAPGRVQLVRPGPGNGWPGPRPHRSPLEVYQSPHGGTSCGAAPCRSRSELMDKVGRVVRLLESVSPGGNRRHRPHGRQGPGAHPRGAPALVGVSLNVLTRTGASWTALCAGPDDHRPVGSSQWSWTVATDLPNPCSSSSGWIRCGPGSWGARSGESAAALRYGSGSGWDLRPLRL